MSGICLHVFSNFLWHLTWMLNEKLKWKKQLSASIPPWIGSFSERNTCIRTDSSNNNNNDNNNNHIVSSWFFICDTERTLLCILHDKYLVCQHSTWCLFALQIHFSGDSVPQSSAAADSMPSTDKSSSTHMNKLILWIVCNNNIWTWCGVIEIRDQFWYRANWTGLHTWTVAV